MSLAVVIPTMNEESYLPRLLRSIKAQSLQPDELVIADAGSTDRTREIAKEFGAKIVEGGMPGPGRNRGAEATKSTHIFFFDSDVELRDPYFLEKALSEFEERGFDLATADVHPIKGTTYDAWSHKIYNRYVRFWGKRRPHMPGFCILSKRSLFKKINGFDEKIVFLEDQDFAVRGGRVGKFGFLESVQVHVSTRRQERDGRINMGVKYVLAEVYYMMLGPITKNTFNYTFGYKKEDYVGEE